ncbi:putative defense protein isoform X1 [Daphnia carinata]|uniref:putative defense protein isoform X1 n=1 Tax=Daphnia carinata TaxID=120202 RepID=UPI00257EA47B|nr:putative defense protein isoform X1 [Daphnia carinata]
MYSARCTGRFVVLCFSALMVSQIVYCKPNGAPLEACEDMSPQHFIMPQSGVCPFTSRLAKDEMWSNGTIEVTLEHDSEDFKGFLMMAFDSTSSDTDPIGTFSADLKGMGKAIDCRSDGTKNAVTHKDKSLKRSVVATWTPPEDFDGSVVFKTTFVKSFDKFWVKQSSSTLRVKRASLVSDSSSGKGESSTTEKPVESTTAKKPSAKSDKEGGSDTTTTRTTTAQPEITDAASPIGILAFYSVIIIGVTIAFIA